MQFILNGCGIDSREALHQTMAAGLHLPEWYGGNLDALHDCLTQRSEPLELIIRDGAALETALGSYAAAFHRVLADCAAENTALRFFWEN